MGFGVHVHIFQSLLLVRPIAARLENLLSVTISHLQQLNNIRLIPSFINRMTVIYPIFHHLLSFLFSFNIPLLILPLDQVLQLKSFLSISISLIYLYQRLRKRLSSIKL